ncbi:high-potential iron-sulfur protein [bacterium]|nr:high-potential iron-sulfur protein [bacterium]
MQRREFIKKSLLTLSAAPALVTLGKRAVAQAPATPTKALELSSPIAVSMGYQHDKGKVDKGKFPKVAAAGAETQFCNNCMLWQQGGLKVEGQEGEWGKCALFMDGLVSAKGWCNSWAPKAT